MFTARYALSPYIKQIRFVFKGLISNVKCTNTESKYMSQYEIICSEKVGGGDGTFKLRTCI
jgi:hypothetical protein